jgi:phosphoglycolate phosphatase-like HAD superfamily hydrolase
MILEGLHRLHGIAARSVMVGDKAGDIAAARAAGLGSAVLIAREAPAGAMGADAVVRSLGDAVSWIAGVRPETVSR